MPKRLAILVVALVASTCGDTPSSGSANTVQPTVRSRFEFPKHCHAFTVQGEVSKEFEGGFARGTKVDVLLIPRGTMPDGEAERVLSGVFVVPHSIMNVLNEDTGEMIKSPFSVCLALTVEQINQLMAAEERGTLRIVPVK